MVFVVCYGMCRLGHGDEKDRSVPTEVEFITSLKEKSVDVSCGGYHTVLLTGILESCYDIIYTALPTRIYTRDIHTICIIASASHTVYSWGWSRNGRLGIGKGASLKSSMHLPVCIEAISIPRQSKAHAKTKSAALKQPSRKAPLCTNIILVRAGQSCSLALSGLEGILF